MEARWTITSPETAALVSSGGGTVRSRTATTIYDEPGTWSMSRRCAFSPSMRGYDPLVLRWTGTAASLLEARRPELKKMKTPSSIHCLPHRFLARR